MKRALARLGLSLGAFAAILSLGYFFTWLKGLMVVTTPLFYTFQHAASWILATIVAVGIFFWSEDFR